MRFLVVGFGSIGKRHFNNLKQRQDITVSVLSRQQLELPKTTVYSTIEEIKEEFDAVIIANETNLHLPTAIKFAERGCHLFIEKPLSDNLEGVDTLVGLVQKHKTRLMIGCNMRFHPAVKLVKKFVTTGKVGQVLSGDIEAGQYLPDWRPGRDYRDSYSASIKRGGGVILDLIHELDYAYWFFGDVSRVFCAHRKKSNLAIETEDVAEILLEFQNGPLCRVHLDYFQRVPSRKIKLVGEDGTICADLNANEVKVFDVVNRDWSIAYRDSEFSRNKMYIDEMEYFTNYVRGKIKEPLIGLHDGLEVLRIVVAAKESSRSGCTVDVKQRGKL